MDVFTILFGVQEQVSLPQECARAILIFIYGLVLLKLSGKRTFGRWSALDIIVSIVVGSMLGRAITGNAPLPGTLAASAVLVGLHVLVAHAVARFPGLALLVEGRPTLLIRNGKIDHHARVASMISESDIDEALRQEGIDADSEIDKVQAMRLEPNGKFSVIKRNDSGHR
jgi:uncharacterized membrane protein YcaP (DUF421 family)